MSHDTVLEYTRSLNTGNYMRPFPFQVQNKLTSNIWAAMENKYRELRAELDNSFHRFI